VLHTYVRCEFLPFNIFKSFLHVSDSWSHFLWFIEVLSVFQLNTRWEQEINNTSTFNNFNTKCKWSDISFVKTEEDILDSVPNDVVLSHNWLFLNKGCWLLECIAKVRYINLIVRCSGYIFDIFYKDKVWEAIYMSGGQWMSSKGNDRSS
jgi:hypothetical protein